MIAQSVTSLLQTRIIGHPLRMFQELPSTNDAAMQLGLEGAPEGVVIFAENQLSGRGRLGRTWESHIGESLTFSVLLRPSGPDREKLSLLAAVALARALTPFASSEVGIKWPNDIYLGGRKIAGILCEAGRDFVVVGIGLNLLQRPEDFSSNVADRAGSLAMFSEQTLKREDILASILNELDKLYLAMPESFHDILAECQARSVLLDRTISVETGGQQTTGRVIGLDPTGKLKLRDDAGIETTICAGEVSLMTI